MIIYLRYVHILLTSSRVRQWNGLCQVAHTLAKELIDLDHTVTWFVADDDYIPSWTDDRIEFLINSEGTRTGWDALAKEVSQVQPDVVHSQGSADAKLRALDAPIVVTSHDNWPHSWTLGWRTAVRNLPAQLRRQRVLQSADQVVGVSEYKTRWLRCRGVSAKCVYNGVEIPSDSPSEGSGFLAAGTVDRRKFADLPAIWRALHTQTDAPLDVVGKIIDQKVAEELRTLPNCEVHGEVESLTPYYEKHRTLLNPTKVDCFGLVPVEAQAHGMSVVAWDRAAMTEVVSKRNGSIITGNDVEDFAQAAQRVYTNADPVVSREWVESEFSASKMAQEYQSVYQSVI